MNLEKINELTAQDMAGVNATILEQLNSDVQLINQLGYYIISGGGKTHSSDDCRSCRARGGLSG
ncbi:octaprenyl diphosphate synthase [Salmonella enterica subsp. enterica]|uniref:Octaprenyl diphosphate synthase n=1 Tax=Salmonella enterica I TaxID=59201 RepID=A0A3S4HRV7_SALET|nr:octaprenyl diphosphate synthase [Salmonella enterica subsp. enterica]